MDTERERERKGERGREREGERELNDVHSQQPIDFILQI